MRTALESLARSIRFLLTRTYDQAQGMWARNEITSRAWRAYLLFYTWGAPRFSGDAGRRRERLDQRRGYAAVERRDRQFCNAVASLGIETMVANMVANPRPTPKAPSLGSLIAH